MAIFFLLSQKVIVIPLWTIVSLTEERFKFFTNKGLFIYNKLASTVSVLNVFDLPAHIVMKLTFLAIRNFFVRYITIPVLYPPIRFCQVFETNERKLETFILMAGQFPRDLTDGIEYCHDFIFVFEGTKLHAYS